ncbi:MAG: hypothetical protein CL928_02645 [Deltaproteobacteria bacterium]|nr:hypothetical protein [Deltaproteobacteria bacterium]
MSTFHTSNSIAHLPLLLGALLCLGLLASSLTLSGCDPLSNDGNTGDDDTGDGGGDDDDGGDTPSEYSYDLGDEAPSGVICGAPEATPPEGALCRVSEGTDALLVQGIILADEVLMGGQVLLDEVGRIACVGCDCSSEPEAAGASQLSCPFGVVSPGLINTHDHISYTQNWPEPHGAERYEHRHDWRRGRNGHTELHVSGGASTEEKAWGELRFVLGGATSILGSGNSDGLLRNLDRDQEGLGAESVHYQTFPLGDSGGATLDSSCGYPNIDSPSVLQTPYAPHISEGIDLGARNEFVCLSSEENGGTDLLAANTAIIHGVGIGAADASLIAYEGAKVIWSPRSNVDLYGNTAPVTMLDSLGVTIALGTDWTASGSMNVLRELACADFLNQDYYGGWFGDWDLWAMTTERAAQAMGIQEATGSLRDGLFGDIAIFDGREVPTNPFRAILDASPGQVHLVLRGGEVLYGDSAVVAALPTGGTGCEELPMDICGQSRRACLSRELGTSYAALEAANASSYSLFSCDTPPDEPSCVPFRPGEYEEATTADPDGDGVPQIKDNCPTVFNPVRPLDQGDQRDHDDDGLGDACDPCPLGENDDGECIEFDPDDRDADGVSEDLDNCPTIPNIDQLDYDEDGTGDACDPCPTRPNAPGGACPATVYELKRGELEPGLFVQLEDLIVTANNEDGFFCQVAQESRDDEWGIDYSGLWVYAPSGEDFTPPAPGERITVTGSVNSWYGQWQLLNVDELTVHQGALSTPTPEDVTVAEVTTGGARANALEGILVAVAGAQVIEHNPPAGPGDVDPTGAFVLEGGLRVNDFLSPLSPLPLIGDTVQVTGLLRFANDNSKVEPRTSQDVAALSSGPPQLLEFGPASVFLDSGLVASTTIPELTVTLDRPAPEDGTSVTLVSLEPTSLEAPAELFFAEGESSLPVPLTGLEPSNGPVDLEATLDGLSLSATVEVLDPSRAPVLETVQPAQATLQVGATTTFTATLDIPAAAFGTPVSLALSDESRASAPLEVVVAEDTLSAEFDVTGTAAGDTTLTATAGGVSLDVLLTVSDVPDLGLVISEVLYDTPSSDDGTEWIELYNGSFTAIDLANYSLGWGGNDYTYGTVQLSTVLEPGACFVLGGPTSDASNGAPIYDLSGDLNPDLQNSGSAADGVALFDVPEGSITTTMTPIDSVIYGSANSNQLLDASGASGPPDVGEASASESLERTASGWRVQSAPTPGDCAAITQ